MSTSHTHVTEDVLTHFLDHLRAGPGAGALLQPLESCSHCFGMARRLLVEASTPSTDKAREQAAADEALSAVFANLSGKLADWQSRAASERRDAPRAALGLLALPYEQRSGAVVCQARFRTLPLVRLLGEASRVAAFGDAARALELAQLATEVADQLETETYGHLVADARAQAWAFLGNAHRVAGDLQAAGRCFQTAHSFLREGTRVDLTLAEVQDLEVSLRRAQGRFEQALKLLETVIKAYERAGDSRSTARVLVTYGCIYQEAGLPQAGLDSVRRALSLLDSEGDAHLYTWAMRVLTLSLAESGDLQQARQCLPETRRLCSLQEDRLALVQLRWLEGRLAREDDVLAEAEAAFVEARRGFLKLGSGYDAALVSLDLARLLADEGRTSEIKLMAHTLCPILEAEDVHQEAFAAMKIFQQAVRMGTVSGQLVSDIADYLRRSRYQPRHQIDLS